VNELLRHFRRQYEWILLLHADDIAKINWIELYLDRIARAKPRTASICSSYDCWFSDTDRIKVGEDDFVRDIELVQGGRGSVIDTLSRGCWWHISGCALRVEHFFDVGEFRIDLPYLGDYEWLLRCLRQGFDIEYIPRTTILYRMHDSSVSSNSFRIGQDLRERLEIFDTYLSNGYVDAATWRSVRWHVITSAMKRILKNCGRGQLTFPLQLLSVCRDAALARRHSSNLT
jgi:GT2 family glycosyltransferase